MLGYDEHRFRAQVNDAVNRIRTILHQLRQPTFPADVFHQYDDKYLMVDFLTNTALASQIHCLELIGLDAKVLETLKEWSKNRSVSVRLSAEEKCVFERKKKRKIEGPTYVTETKGILGTGTKKEKVVTTVKDYFWKFSVEYELFVYKGNNPAEKIIFRQRTGTYEIMTNSKSSPHPSSSVQPSIDLDITWLLSKLGDGNTLNFHIDRADAKRCRTPRRNPNVESVLSYITSFYGWAGRVISYFFGHLFPIQEVPKLDLSKISDTEIFVPVVPLFESRGIQEAAENANGSEPECRTKFLVSYNPSAIPEASVVLPAKDLNLFLQEELRGMEERFREFDQMFPDDGNLITAQEAKIVLVMIHLRKGCAYLSDGIEHVEIMLQNQLVAAIGKAVTPVDFVNYMEYHNKKIFKPEYQSQMFSYAIRQPNRFPEGTLEINVRLDDGTVASPIKTIVRHSLAAKPMRFSVSAATEISFFGHRYLHGYVEHQFSGETGTSLVMSARARQFSSFIVMIGTITSSDLFEPKHAMIVQNKDDISIPLLLETLPTPKAFRDAIESLSPEQQRFAKAYRSMQLSSTVFAVVVLQVRPQLEKLMKLPADSLTKELKLTQHLLELLIQYQIPSDLLCFGGKPELTLPQKVRVVQRNADAIQAMIDEVRQKELDDAEAKKKHQALLEQMELDRPIILSDAMYEPLCYEGMNYSSLYSCIPLNLPLPCSAPIQLPNASLSLPSPPPAAPVATQTVSLSKPPKPQLVEQQQQDTPKQLEQKHDVPKEPSRVVINLKTTDEDYTKIPSILDNRFDNLDLDNAVRATIIKTEKNWERDTLPSLLATPVHEHLDRKRLKDERKKAFDLADALSRSGSLPFDEAELHVVLASTHCFSKTLMNTVIQDNINPIEKLERSMLIVATTIQQQPAEELIKEEHLAEVSEFSPNVFAGSPPVPLIAHD